MDVSATAFGEIVTLDSGVASRYGYVGAHGYEEHDYDSGDGGTTYRGDGVPDNLLGRSATDGFPFMHTGARYYDPSTGRFLQRDPIGISGGLNVYAYCGNNPVIRIDPNGRDWDDIKVGLAKVFLWGTGGMNSWLDDRVSVDRWGRRFAGVSGAAAGIAVICVSPGSAYYLTRGSIFWGTGRGFFDVTTGSSYVDAWLDGAAIGTAIKTVAGPYTGGGGLRPPMRVGGRELTY